MFLRFGQATLKGKNVPNQNSIQLNFKTTLTNCFKSSNDQTKQNYQDIRFFQFSAKPPIWGKLNPIQFHEIDHTQSQLNMF